VQRKNRLPAILMLAALAVSACQDFPTAAPVERQPIRSPDVPYSPLSRGTPEYVCFTSELSPGREHPYHYTSVTLHFPATELGDGQTRMFRLHVQAAGQAPTIAASCRIPNTRAAAERLYNTLARGLAHRARLEPLRYTAPRNEPPRYVDTRRQVGAVPPRPRMDVASDPCGGSGCTLDPLIVIGTPSSEEWPDADWGWGSQGDTYYSGGYGDTWDPAAEEGPILGFIICMVGFVGAGFTIYDVYDTARQLAESKQVMESNQRTYEMYIQQPEQDPATRLMLEYMWQQSKLVYTADAHTLAIKIAQSDAAVIGAAFACGGSLVSPTP
jgi:hypothetical protein